MNILPAGAPTPEQLKAQLDEIKAKGIKQEKPKATRPAGWWALCDLTGTLTGVSAAVDASDVPTEWKAAIKAAMVRACGADYNAVYLDAHFTVDAGNSTLHLTIQPSKMLT